MRSTLATPRATIARSTAGGIVIGETMARILADVASRVVYALEAIRDGDPAEAAYVLGDLERDVLAHAEALQLTRRP